MASPATPSPTASADGARRENKKRADDEKQSGAKKRKASSKISGADRRGSGGRDALGVLRTNARGGTRRDPPGVGGGTPSPSLPERAAGGPVGTGTFSSWKAGGALERAVADVMRRAGSVGKYAYGIRGSSLVTQVEQALGVGSGALRGHGRRIRLLAQAEAKPAPRQRA